MPVGTETCGTTGSIRLDRIRRECATNTSAVRFGTVLLNDQIGWSPFGAAIVIRIRVPLR
jgi:hypothetical protein